MEEVNERAEDALEEAAESTWLERLARAGLAARGLLYVVVAILAVQVATGHRRDPGRQAGRAPGRASASRSGVCWSLGLAVGFAGYAMWRFVEAAVGPPDEPDAPRRSSSGSATRPGAVCTPSSAPAR